MLILISGCNRGVFVTISDLFYELWRYNCEFDIVRLWNLILFLWILYLYDAALGSYTFLYPRVLNDHFPCLRMSPTFVFSQWACYILHGSFSTSTNDCMINVFTLLRASQMSHLFPSIPEFPITHEQSFIRIAPSSLDSLESRLLFETLLCLRDY